MVGVTHAVIVGAAAAVGGAYLYNDMVIRGQEADALAEKIASEEGT